jgi:hypothetical protein
LADGTLPTDSPTDRLLRRIGKSFFYLPNLSKPDPFPGVSKPEWRAFEFMIESITLSANYVCLLLGYAYFRLAGFGPGDVPYDFWFPFGSDSLRFLLLSGANDLLQDLISHPIATLASHRWTPLNFNRMFPGWIYSWDHAGKSDGRTGAKHLVLVVGSVAWAPMASVYMGYVLRYIEFLPEATD